MITQPGQSRDICHPSTTCEYLIRFCVLVQSSLQYHMPTRLLAMPGHSTCCRRLQASVVLFSKSVDVDPLASCQAFLMMPFRHAKCFLRATLLQNTTTLC
jgi:hypothetical protein